MMPCSSLIPLVFQLSIFISYLAAPVKVFVSQPPSLFRCSRRDSSFTIIRPTTHPSREKQDPDIAMPLSHIAPCCAALQQTIGEWWWWLLKCFSTFGKVWNEVWYCFFSLLLFFTVNVKVWVLPPSLWKSLALETEWSCGHFALVMAWVLPTPSHFGNHPD